MKNGTRIEEMEKAVNFAAVNEKLLKLVESGELKRKKTLADILDKVKESLDRARQKGVSMIVLANFLKESGIKVSEGSLRNYFKNRETGDTRKHWKKREKKKKKDSQNASKQTFQSHTTTASPAVRLSWKTPLTQEEHPLPPRLARRNPL